MTQNLFLATDGEPLGPFTPAQVKALAGSGRLRPEDLVRLEGQTNWVKASAVKGLFPAPSAASSAVVGTATAPAVVVPATPPAGSVASGKPPGVEPSKAKDAVAALLSRRRPLAAAAALLVAALLVGGLVKARQGGPETTPEGQMIAARPGSDAGDSATSEPAPDDGPAPVRTGSDLDDMARLLGQEAVVGSKAIRRPADPRLIEEIRARTGSSVPAVREASARPRRRSSSGSAPSRFGRTPTPRAMRSSMRPRRTCPWRCAPGRRVGPGARRRCVQASDHQESGR